MLISILIQTKNEPYIQQLVNKINKVIKQRHEIIVIDKSLKTPKIKGVIVLKQESDGLGNAILEGLKKAKGNLIVTMDGDGSHDPEDLKKMLEKIPEYDIVIGSKLVPGGKTEDSLSRITVTTVTNLLTRMILGIKVKDPMTGFMLVKRNSIEKIKLKPRGYKIVVEVIYKSKAKITEVPITFHKRKAGKTKVGFNIKGFKEFFRIIILLVEMRLGVNK
jgi:dolichol-phosphate mannosyltransferase